jgi:hypothetical protein
MYLQLSASIAQSSTMEESLTARSLASEAQSFPLPPPPPPPPPPPTPIPPIRNPPPLLFSSTIVDAIV